MTKKYITIVGCFDTKSEVFEFLYQEISKVYPFVITINTGTLGSTDLFPVNFTSESVAEAAGEKLAITLESGLRTDAVEVMGRGAKAILKKLSDENKLAGVIGMGGGGGSYIVLNSFQDVPFGIPKICISTLATKDVSHLIGSKDIVLVPSIVDVAGLNSISKVLISQSAASIIAMSQVEVDFTKKKKRIAISMFGNTTACVAKCTELLEARNFEVFAFHANGSGGRTMEELIQGGYFDALLDITTTELADELCGGICSAGAGRGQSASKVGIPQVVVPGCLDMVNFGGLSSVPEKYKNRHLYSWSPDVTLMRTNEVENKELGTRLINNLKDSTSSVSVIIPSMGISQIDQKGSDFYNEDANNVLFMTLESEAAMNNIDCRSVPYHINEPEFAMIVVSEILNMILLDPVQQ